MCDKHPAPADQLTASVAAVVASYDNNYCYYSTAVRVQQNANGEMIMDFKVMLFDLLCEYRRRNNDQLPQKIIFYRDGVSEGQFDSVLDHEHKKMLEAFQDLGPDYKPKVTFVVVQKRHHTRSDFAFIDYIFIININ
jgi:eukaryotic translation initiation factor 2C